MPAALDLAPLAAMAVICACILILWAWQATGGQLVKFLIFLLEGITPSILGHRIDVFGPIINALKAMDNAVKASIGKLVQANQWAWNRFVHWNAYVWSEVSKAGADLADETGRALHALRNSTVPLLISGALAPLLTRIAALEADAKRAAGAVTHEITHITKVIESHPTIVKPETVVHVTKVIAAKAAALPQAIANPWPRIHGIDETLKETLERIRENSKKLTVAGITGLVVAAIGQLGFGWVRCSKVGRAGKALCGMDENLLQSILSDALLIGSTISIVELAKECQGFTATVEEPLKLFVRELKQVNPLAGGDYTAALRAYAAGNF